LFANGTTVARLGVHRTSTTRSDRFVRGLESLSIRGFAGFRCDVHSSVHGPLDRERVKELPALLGRVYAFDLTTPCSCRRFERRRS
jgi:hypothetical protein